DGAGVARCRRQIAAERGADAVRHAGVIVPWLEVDEVRAPPRRPGVQCDARGGRAVEARREVALVGPGVGPEPGRVDPEGLIGLTAVVAPAPHTPAQRHLVLVARPGAAARDDGARRGAPLGLASGLPVFLAILLAVAVGVPAARRIAPPEHVGPVGPAHVDPFAGTGVVAETPDVVPRIAGQAAR